jgi:hypothetical protein
MHRSNRSRLLCSLLTAALVSAPAAATARPTVVDCDAAAMEDVNWALDFARAHLDETLATATYLPSKYTDRIRKDWDRTSIKCSGKSMCAERLGTLGFDSGGDQIRLCWDNIRQPGLAINRCRLVEIVFHETGHAAGIPIEHKHNDWTLGYPYVPTVDLVYRLGKDANALCVAAASCAPGTASGPACVPADWSAGLDLVESSDSGKLAVGDFCARDSQCHSGKCEKGICTCDANKDCPGSLRCVNRIGKNFCVPPGGSALGAYCQKNSDCGPGTCNNNLCVCSTDAECKGLVSGSPRCAKPLGQRNFCQPTSVALAAACERDSDCTSGKCRKDLCVP